MHGIAENSSNSLKAIILLGHGSRAEGANRDMYKVVDIFHKKWPDRIVTAAFLEINEPSIPDCIDTCAKKGAEEILLTPYFLHMGNHVRKDLPHLVEIGASRNPNVKIHLGPHLGFHEKIIDIVSQRIEEGLEEFSQSTIAK